jgi:hypothetical protein
LNQNHEYQWDLIWASQIFGLIPKRELIDFSCPCHHILQKLYLRTVCLQNIWVLKFISFLHTTTFEKQYCTSKSDLHQKAVIYRGHPSCYSYRLQLSEKVKALIYYGLRNYFLYIPESFYLTPFSMLVICCCSS